MTDVNSDYIINIAFIYEFHIYRCSSLIKKQRIGTVWKYTIICFSGFNIKKLLTKKICYQLYEIGTKYQFVSDHKVNVNIDYCSYPLDDQALLHRVTRAGRCNWAEDVKEGWIELKYKIMEVLLQK